MTSTLYVACILTDEFHWQVSILSAGTFFGALLAFPMGDMVGRKWGLIMSCLVFSLGIGLQLDTKWATFVIGRVIAGVGVVCNPFGMFIAFPISFLRVLCHASFPCINQRYGVVYPDFPLPDDDSKLRT